jgi:hypothetical protein
VSFWSPTFFAGLFAFILATVFHGSWVVSAFTLGGICLVTQILSPWNKEAAKAREAREEKDEESNAFKWAFANAKPAVPPAWLHQEHQEHRELERAWRLPRRCRGCSRLFRESSA